MTAAEITEYLGWTRRRVNSCITTARLDHGSWYFRIVGYRNQRGVGGQYAPVYGLGPGKDLPRPKVDPVAENRARQKRYRDKHRAIINMRNRARRGAKATNPFDQLIRLSK